MYNRLTRLKSYWENDFEVESRHIASKNSKKCLNDLKFQEFYWKFLNVIFRFFILREIFRRNFYFIKGIEGTSSKLNPLYVFRIRRPLQGSPAPDPPRDNDLLYTGFHSIEQSNVSVITGFDLILISISNPVLFKKKIFKHLI